MVDTHTSDMKTGITRRLIQIVVLFTVLAAILFLSSGQLRWLWGWVYIAVYIAGTVVNTVLLLRTNPEVIAERGKTEIEQNWEKIVGGLWALAYFLAIPLLAGLDERYGWSPALPVTANLVSALLFAASLALVGWALVENAYFVTVARVQKERNQTVCTTGPYRFVRHPGYLGAVVQGAAAPLLLGSTWALIPGLVSSGLMILRTALEDRMLHRELAGYAVYARQVRYRILPGVW